VKTNAKCKQVKVHFLFNLIDATTMLLQQVHIFYLMCSFFILLKLQIKPNKIARPYPFQCLFYDLVKIYRGEREQQDQPQL
jgi:hypothetical protein